MPINHFEATLKDLQEQHKKAVHFVKASRIINDFNQIVESSSDDGEPKGSSGVPVLNVLRGKELVNCACVVVRYFGGRLLGVGGLVRAYSNATLLAVDYAEENGFIVDFLALKPHKITIAFNQINRLKYIANKMDINIIKTIFLDKTIEVIFECEDEKYSDFISFIN